MVHGPILHLRSMCWSRLRLFCYLTGMPAEPCQMGWLSLWHITNGQNVGIQIEILYDDVSKRPRLGPVMNRSAFGLGEQAKKERTKNDSHTRTALRLELTADCSTSVRCIVIHSATGRGWGHFRSFCMQNQVAIVCKYYLLRFIGFSDRELNSLGFAW